MAKVLTVSRGGYYRFKNHKPSKRAQERAALLEKIKESYERSRQTYGSPRIRADLQDQGIFCSRKRIGRLMRQAGLVVKMKKRFKVTTRVDSQAKVAPNLLKQDFTAEHPNQRWVADITYIPTSEGWLYVAAVLDLFSRRIVGLAMSERLTTTLVSVALRQAVTHRKPPNGLTHHSDRGCQYTSHDFQRFLKSQGMIPSMSGTGNCYDNAAMESFFHTLKTEHVFLENYRTRKEAQQSIFEYVEVFYNRQRRHSTLGYLSPMAFENQAYQKNNEQLQSVH